MVGRYGLQIRSATPADGPGIAQLLVNCGLRIEIEALAKRLEMLQQAPGTVLLALEWGPPSGMIVSTWYPVLMSDHPVARITSILVGPDERRRGIGRLLLKAVSQAARAANCSTLHIPAWDGELTVSAFASACGFEARGNDYVRGLRKGGPDRTGL